MRAQVMRLEERNERYCGVHRLTRFKNTNTADLKRKANFLLKLIDNELTEQQRLCATAYWLNGQKQKDIAAALKLHPSTVSRHITAARKKLQSVARYYDEAPVRAQ